MIQPTAESNSIRVSNSFRVSWKQTYFEWSQLPPEILKEALWMSDLSVNYIYHPVILHQCCCYQEPVYILHFDGIKLFSYKLLKLSLSWA